MSHSLTKSLTHSLTPQKCSPNRLKLSDPTKKNMLIKALVVPTPQKFLGSERCGFIMIII